MALLQISDGQTILIVCPPSLTRRSAATDLGVFGCTRRQLQVFSWGKDCPPNLRAFLENPKILKLGVGILRASKILPYADPMSFGA
jgi:hypothetical protein